MISPNHSQGDLLKIHTCDWHRLAAGPSAGRGLCRPSPPQLHPSLPAALASFGSLTSICPEHLPCLLTCHFLSRAPPPRPHRADPPFPAPWGIPSLPSSRHTAVRLAGAKSNGVRITHQPNRSTCQPWCVQEPGPTLRTLPTCPDGAPPTPRGPGQSRVRPGQLEGAMGDEGLGWGQLPAEGYTPGGPGKGAFRGRTSTWGLRASGNPSHSTLA